MTTEMSPLTVPGRYNGPDDSGNGGFTAGLLAELLPPPADGYAVQVTLRTPPPLDTPLTVAGLDGGAARVQTPDGTLVAEAAAVAFDDPPAAPVPVPDAEAAAHAYPGFTTHPFPQCFVCGPHRPHHDGLAIYPGPVAPGRTAAPWRVPDGATEATVWAALDCPGGWTVLAEDRPYVLGRLTARVATVPNPGEPCVVTGALQHQEGRKAQVRTALYAAHGACLAHAAATWIALL